MRRLRQQSRKKSTEDDEPDEQTYSKNKVASIWNFIYSQAVLVSVVHCKSPSIILAGTRSKDT